MCQTCSEYAACQPTREEERRQMRGQDQTEHSAFYAHPEKIRVATTYNAAADHFDDDPLAFWDRTGRETVVRMGLNSGARVLDVACGSGASALPAAERVGPGGAVLG